MKQHVHKVAPVSPLQHFRGFNGSLMPFRPAKQADHIHPLEEFHGCMRSRGQRVDLDGQIKIALRDAAGIVRGQVDCNTIIDI